MTNKVSNDKLLGQISVATAQMLKTPTIKRTVLDMAYELEDQLNTLENGPLRVKNRGPPYEGLRTDYWKCRVENYHANQYQVNYNIVLENTQPDHQYSVPYMAGVYKPSPYAPTNNLGKYAKSGMVRVGFQKKNLVGYIGNLSRVRQDMKGGIVKPKKKHGKLVWWNKRGEIVFRTFRKRSWFGHEGYKNIIEDKITRFFSRGNTSFSHTKKGKEEKLFSGKNGRRI